VSGDLGGGSGVDEFGHRRRDRPHAGYRVGACREDTHALRSDHEHSGASDECLCGGSVKHIRGSDEVRDEPVDRIFVDLAGRADLLDAPVVENCQPVTHAQRLVLVMGDDDEGDADFALDRLELDLHLLAELEVHRGEWLVEQQHSRPTDQCPCERDALTLSAR
jgi:hypothetical protein